MKIFIPLFSLFIFSSTAGAENIRLVAPYYGSLTNTYRSSSARYSLSLRDTGILRGVYAQWINTEKFQGNIFYYESPEVNYSKIRGFHGILDWYIKTPEGAKYVLGAGLDNINIAMDAKDNISAMKAFRLTNDVLYGYARLGRYFYASSANTNFTLMPYCGYSVEKVTGWINMWVAKNPPPTLRPTKVSISDDADYALGGLNFSAVYRHFLELQLKYMGRLAVKIEHDLSGMSNIYLRRNLGISYRYKLMQFGNCKNDS